MAKLNLSERLRMAREARGLNQRELGRAAGLTHSHVSILESGRTTPTVDTMAKLAAALDVSLDWLVSGTGEPPVKAA